MNISDDAPETTRQLPFRPIDVSFSFRTDHSNIPTTVINNLHDLNKMQGAVRIMLDSEEDRLYCSPGIMRPSSGHASSDTCSVCNIVYTHATKTFGCNIYRMINEGLMCPVYLAICSPCLSQMALHIPKIDEMRMKYMIFYMGCIDNHEILFPEIVRYIGQIILTNNIH